MIDEDKSWPSLVQVSSRINTENKLTQNNLEDVTVFVGYNSKAIMTDGRVPAACMLTLEYVNHVTCPGQKLTQMIK